MHVVIPPPDPKNLAPTLGGQVVNWIETFCVHGPGAVQGQAVELDDEFVAFTYRAYELRPNGKRQFNRAFLSRCKGRSKSGFAAMLAWAEACGPVRFSGRYAKRGEVSWWGYEYDEGEPIGEPVAYAEILCVATEEDQAGNTYDAIKFIGEKSATLRASYPGIECYRERVVLPNDRGTIEPITTSNDSKDGGKSTFVVADETHLWTIRRLIKLHRTITRNLGKSGAAVDGWMLETSTMYAPGEKSVAEGTHKAAYATGQQLARGRLKMADVDVLFDHVQGDPKWDIRKPTELKRAIIEAAGAGVAWIDVERRMRFFSDPQQTEADNRRYWLNQATPDADQWITPPEWEPLTRERPPLGARICLGFDGSLNNDSTGLVASRTSDGRLFKIALWAKPLGPAGHGWQVDRADVDRVVRQTFADYDVVYLYADPPHFESYIDAWEAAFPDRVVRFWTNAGKAMSRAIEDFETQVRAGELTHDGDSDLADHIYNARTRSGRGGEQLTKADDDSKIDLAVCAVLANEARGTAVAKGLKDAPEPTEVEPSVLLIRVPKRPKEGTRR